MSDEEKVKKLALSMIGKIDSIKKVREYMFEDLDKTIALANTSRGAPNFMIALALCAYTEYWGKFIFGEPEGHSEECFKAFFRKLGKCYGELLDKPELIYNDRQGNQRSLVYREVRCGLAHAYMIEGNANINLGRGTCGVEYDLTTKIWTFNILTYYEDFKRAVDRYIANLQNGQEDIIKFESAFEGKPTLI